MEAIATRLGFEAPPMSTRQASMWKTKYSAYFVSPCSLLMFMLKMYKYLSTLFYCQTRISRSRISQIFYKSAKFEWSLPICYRSYNFSILTLDFVSRISAYAGAFVSYLALRKLDFDVNRAERNMQNDCLFLTFASPSSTPLPQFNSKARAVQQ